VQVEVFTYHRVVGLDDPVERVVDLGLNQTAYPRLEVVERRGRDRACQLCAEPTVAAQPHLKVPHAQEPHTVDGDETQRLVAHGRVHLRQDKALKHQALREIK
jgi:hypothetical protein